MRKIKKKEEREKETEGDVRGKKERGRKRTSGCSAGKVERDEKRGKTSGDIFRKELRKPKRPVEFHTMAFRTVVKGATSTARKWNLYPTIFLPFFPSFGLLYAARL